MKKVSSSPSHSVKESFDLDEAVPVELVGRNLPAVNRQPELLQKEPSKKAHPSAPLKKNQNLQALHEKPAPELVLKVFAEAASEKTRSTCGVKLVEEVKEFKEVGGKKKIMGSSWGIASVLRSAESHTRGFASQSAMSDEGVKDLEIAISKLHASDPVPIVLTFLFGAHSGTTTRIT